MTDDKIPEEIAAKISAACAGYKASDVMYAIGLVIADAIRDQCTDKDPKTTFGLLRDVVDLELSTPSIR